MNKTFRLVWNELINAWVAVSEITKGRGKRSSKALLLTAAIAVLPAPTIAQTAPPPNTLPTGGNVVAGTANITQSGPTMNINQSSHQGVIDWGTFNVGAAATVNFNQPSSSAATLNRVVAPNPSQIFGRINANGQVFLTNPSGIYFGRSASVNVGSFAATTHSISNTDFMAGKLNFTRNGATGKIENEGQLTAAFGGFIALLAPEVRNNGVVIAQGGTVALAAGEAYELQFDGARLANIRVEPATIAALVENGNAVHAPGGLIILSAQAANRLQGGVINNTGSLEAAGLVDNGGTIRLTASDRISHTGSINVDAVPGKVGAGGMATLITELANHDGVAEINGSLSARGGDLGGDGGFIETSGGRVLIGATARVSTAAPKGAAGTWLIDPTDFTISSGTAAQTTSGIGATTLQNALGTGNVSILTSNTASGSETGVINVNADIAWNANTLTLRPHAGLNVNAVMSATGTSILSLSSYWATSSATPVNIGINPSGSFKGRIDFGSRSGTGFFSNGGTAYYVLNASSLGAAGSTTGTDLQGMAGSLAGKFALGANIDAAATSAWNSGSGFSPVGNNSGAFTGTFDGLGHTISGLTINRSGTMYVGLFGKIGSNTIIRNVGVANASVTGAGFTGILVGHGGSAGSNYGIRNSFSTGTVTGTSAAAGANPVGGLVGGYGSIASSFSSANVSATSYVGGLTGLIGTATPISRSFATGTVNGSRAGYGVGGLVGYGNYASVNNSYATGTVTGLAGQTVVGGLIGKIRTNAGSTITNNYATGLVNATNGQGFIGSFSGAGTVINNFWNTDTSGKATSAGGVGVVGKTTTQMKDSTTFSGAGWDTTSVWKVNASINGGYPFLCSVNCLTSIFLRLSAGGSSIYGETPSFSYGYYFDAAAGTSVTDASPTGTVSWSGAPTSTSNVGIYSLTYNNGISIGNTDYALVAGNAINWTVNTRPININANGSQSKVYGDADPTYAYTLEANSSGRGLSGSDTFSGALSRAAGENVGTPYAIGQGTLANTNYNISFTSANFAISQRPITVTAADKSKVYGDTDPTLTYAVTSGNLISSDALTGALSRAAGENVNTYSINASALANGNYLITKQNGTLTISQRPITVTAADKSKVYGDTDPTLTYAVTTGSLVTGDSLTGALTRAAGENVSTYSIDASALANGNYLITKQNGTLTISQRPITVTAVDKSKVYGDTDPTLSYAVTTGSLVGSDSLTGALSRAAGENVNTYSIDASALANGNYLITANNGNLSITRRPLTVIADAKSKIEGAADQALTYQAEAQGISRGLMTGENLAGSLTRAAPTDYAIQQGTVANANNSNYNISYVGANLTINAAPPPPPDSTTGTTDIVTPPPPPPQPPPLLPPVTPPAPPTNTGGSIGGAGGGFTSANPLLNNNPAGVINLGGGSSGSVGGSSSSGLGSGGTSGGGTGPGATSTPGGTGASGGAGTGGNGDPGVTGGSAGLGTSQSSASSGTGGPANGGISVSLVKEPSVQSTGIIAVSVPKEMATAGSGFSFPLPAQVTDQDSSASTIQVATTGGEPLPDWLRFNPEAKAFVASAVPDGAFPIQVVVTVGGTRTTVVIISVRNE